MEEGDKSGQKEERERKIINVIWSGSYERMAQKKRNRKY